MMNKEILAVYSAGLIQGIALVAFPAASTILTSPEEFNFSTTSYGSLFIPQSLISIAASAINPKLTRILGSKSVLVTGLIANLVSMALLALSVVVMKNQVFSYVMLLLATGCLGLGFGLVVPSLNAVAALLYPTKVDSTILVLNALLGVGTALAPVFIGLFVAIGFWWGLPLLMCLLLVCLLVFCIPLKLPGEEKYSAESTEAVSIPIQFWIFALFAILYGIIETLNGNWVSIYMSKELHATLEVQSLALTAFWGMVTFGRVFYAAIDRVFSEKLAFQISPFISSAALLFIASLKPGGEYWGIMAFGLAGFGCSALLPLTISFGTKQLKSIASSVPGMIISFYLLGYGIAAFGVGPLEELAQINLSTVYVFGGILAFILGVIALFIGAEKIKDSNETIA